MAKSSIEGMEDLLKSIKTVGGVPQKFVTKAAKAGGTIILKAIRASAPKDTGELADGFIMRLERRKLAGKSTYDIEVDPSKNDIFQKTSKTIRRKPTKWQKRNRIKLGNLKTSYYPVSQEYGFLTKDGGYVPGLRFMRTASEDNEGAFERTVVDVMSKEIEKAWNKGG